MIARANDNIVAQNRETHITTRKLAEEDGKTNRLLYGQGLQLTDQREARAVQLRMSAEQAQSEREGRDVQLRLSAEQAQSEREERATRLQLSAINAETERMRIQADKGVELARLDAANPRGRPGRAVEQYVLAMGRTIGQFIHLKGASRTIGIGYDGSCRSAKGDLEHAGGSGWGFTGAGGAGVGAGASSSSPSSSRKRTSRKLHNVPSPLRFSPHILSPPSPHIFVP